MRIAALLIALLGTPAAAEVVMDGGTGPALSLEGPDFAVEAGLGRREGGNLFHSFQRFNLARGESALFSGPDDVARIIGRVSGGSASYLDGTLRCTVPNADLYLFNSAGVSFGPHAGLDVNGSFYAASADYLVFADGARFAAGVSENSRFSSAPPSAFGFTAAAPAPIHKEQSFLRVPAGKTLALLGGDVYVNDAHYEEELQGLSAPGGTLHLAAAGGPAEIPLDSAAALPLRGELHISDLPLNPVNAGHPANLDAGATPGMDGGGIILQGGRVFLENAYVFSDTAGDGAGGGVSIHAADLHVHASRVTAETLPAAKGRGGTLEVQAQRVLLSGGAQLSTTTYGGGDGGDVRVNAEERVSIRGELRVLLPGAEEETIFPSGLQSTSTSRGDGGLIEVRTPLLEMEQGALLGSNARARGTGGTVRLEVDRLLLDNSRIEAKAVGVGNAGDLRIQVGERMELRNEAAFSTQAAYSGGGNISIDGAASWFDVRDSEITARAEGEGRDHAGGDVFIRNNGFFILRDSLVLASAVHGDGGDIDITARHFVPSSDSILNASSDLGVDGRVLVNAPDTNLEEGLTPRSDLLDARALLDSLCQVRNGGELSRFLVNRYAGAMQEPEDWLGSPALPALLADDEALSPVLREVRAAACVHADSGRYGRYADVQALLKEYLAAARSPAEQALLHSHAADLWLAVQRPLFAEQYLEQARSAAELLDEAEILAHVLNNQGNFYAAAQDYTKAVDFYAAADAAAHGASPLRARVLLNRAHALMNKGEAYAPYLEEALDILKQLDDGPEKTLLNAAAADLLLRGGKTAQAYARLKEIHRLAESTGDKRFSAYALGRLGELYARGGRREEALRLFREALFYSQNIPDALYFWEWRRGQLLQEQEELLPAQRAYARALAQLEPIRERLRLGRRDVRALFEARIYPLYFSAADVLLRRAAREKAREQELLRQAKAVLERLKTAELENYFQDACVTRRKNSLTQSAAPDAGSAVLYPLLLPRRTVLLMEFEDGLKQITVPVAGAEVKSAARKLGRYLQIKTRWRFTEPAKQLYQWLIAPLEEELRQRGVETLIVVPDGVLRTIPFAALFDGKEYLLQKFTTAVTPALSLTDGSAFTGRNAPVLLNGLSEKVFGFSALPSVQGEIARIESLFEDNAVLLNQAFTPAAVSRELQQRRYGIMHVASHGQFDRDPARSFLLAYKDKLSLDRLEHLLRFTHHHEEPLELLTLSACQTAVGDERAALGLAGVAVKSGARSALASLWFVSDEATSELMVEFYRRLREPDVSKPLALRQAQLAMLKQKRFQHPAYWAPFLLIGNWR